MYLDANKLLCQPKGVPANAVGLRLVAPYSPQKRAESWPNGESYLLNQNTGIQQTEALTSRMLSSCVQNAALNTHFLHAAIVGVRHISLEPRWASPACSAWAARLEPLLGNVHAAKRHKR